jgi:hypothetical protein
MRKWLTLIALMAGTVLPAAGAFGTPVTADQDGHTGIGIRLVDAPVATRDNPRARVYIIDHVAPGTRIERRIEVSNDTGKPAQVVVYSGAAEIRGGSFVGLEGDTPNELSSWTKLSSPQLDLADGATTMVDATIDVPSDAAPGEQYAVVWAQTTSAARQHGGVTQVSRVGVRIYLSVGPGGEPASDFAIESLTSARDSSGAPVVRASIHNTGGRALDLGGTLELTEGPGGLSAGPFPVSLGTTLGVGQTESITIRLDKLLPNGPWKADIEVTSGLLRKNARASITFPDAGTGDTVSLSNGISPWWWVGGAGLALVTATWRVWARRRRDEQPEPKHSLAAAAEREATPIPQMISPLP